MTSTASGLRITVASIKATYGDSLPEIDQKMYTGRTYTLAAANCYAAACAAAMCNRDNMAMQFYRHALLISNALCPPYPKDRDDQDNEIERSSEAQVALDSELQASQMAIASNYGILTYLNRADEAFVFINLYREAHKACMTAHEEAKALRHSPIDSEFAEVVQAAVEAIGVYYNNELTIWTEAVNAKESGTLPELSADVYIAETPAQRRQHAASDMDALLGEEQKTIGELLRSRDAAVTKLVAISAEIVKQSEITNKADAAFELAKTNMDACRKTLEQATGTLSELASGRSELRVVQATTDAKYYRLSERHQILVNLRAYAAE